MPAGRHVSPGASHAVFSFPSADQLFRRSAEDAVDALRTPGQPTWTHLRVRYPDAELHHQRAALVDDRRVDVWFAFRDGREEPSCPMDQWWGEPGAAMATLHASGRVTDRSRSFQRMFGGGVRTGLSGVADLLAAPLVEALSGPRRSDWSRSVTSTAQFSTTTGVANLEFRIDWGGGGPDRHQFTVRTAADRTAAHYEAAVRDSSLGVLSLTQRAEVLRGSRLITMERGERLEESVVGGPWAALVVCGVARLYAARDSVEPTVSLAAPGTLLGSHIGPGESPLVIGFQAVTPCRVVRIDPLRVARMMHTEKAFSIAIAADARDTLATLLETYGVRSAAGLGRRLARDLVALADLHGEGGFLPVTEQQLADGLGSIRESVARTIGGFRRRGWIVTTRYGIILRDPEAVAAYGAVS
jgi:CRP-like cAMP-binding protein